MNTFELQSLPCKFFNLKLCVHIWPHVVVYMKTIPLYIHKNILRVEDCLGFFFITEFAD